MEHFVARQPIFDRDRHVFAYELLFRSGRDMQYASMNDDYATASVLSNSFMSIGMTRVTGGKLAFVNFTEKLLLDEIPTIFPKELVAVEVLENVAPTESVVEKCKKFRDLGYLIVLDDFEFRDDYASLLELADIIKVDFRVTQNGARAQIMKQVACKRIKFLAEKVETQEEYKEALELGYDYFQGYYFTKPDIISGSGMPETKLNSIRMMQQVNGPDLNFDQLEHIFKQDVSLAYKLLRYVNSAFFNLPSRIKSIRHALTMIGLWEARKWLSLMALNNLAEDKPAELVRMSLIRANLCEKLAPLFNLEENTAELFLMGLLSCIDALVDQPMEQLLEQLSLSPEIKGPLLGEESPYQMVYALVIAYEQGDWGAVYKHADGLDLKIVELTDCFLDTIEKANQIVPG